MKVLLALAVLTTSAVSLASDRSIYDIMYLPKAGTTYGFTEGNLLNRTVEPKQGDETEISGFALEQTLGHSLTDRLSLNASIGYGNVTLDDGTDESDITGLSDPRLTAKFRVMDESLRFDVLGGALLGVQDHEFESNGDTDFNQGGHALFVGAQVGGKSESFQWAVLGQLTNNFERTTDVAGTDVDSDSNNELLLRLDILNKLAEKSYLRSFVGADFIEELESDVAALGDPSLSIYAIGTEYQHLLSADLLLRAGVDYSIYKYSPNSIDSDTAWNFRVAANYEF